MPDLPGDDPDTGSGDRQGVPAVDNVLLLGEPWDAYHRLLNEWKRAKDRQHRASVADDPEEKWAADWAASEADADLHGWESGRVSVFLFDLRLAVKHDAAAVWDVLETIFVAREEAQRINRRRPS